MQGDFKLPGAKPSRSAPTPKPDNQPPEPDITIDESGKSDVDNAAKRRVLIAPHKHFIRFWRWWMSLNRNVRFGIIAGLLLGFGIIAVLWYAFIQPSSNPTLSITKHPPKPKQPITVASPLTGVQVSPDLAARPVTAVMIENSDGARPQSGLQDAGIVYEAVAEGGVTRFMALFQETTPQYIGPVRSLRPYFIDFAQPFQASIVHVGGSPDALARVRNGSYRDLDEFFNAGYFWRINSRYAPHNVYTSFAKLDALNKAKGYKHSNFTPWPRKADQKLAVPTAVTINILISGPDYYVNYHYDAASNTYSRFEAGAKHLDIVDAAGKKVVWLHPKVVIAMVVPRSNGSLDASGAYYSNYADVGSGQAFAFQDGGETTGVWKKTSAGAGLQFLTGAGQPLKLDAGQTWITLISPGELNYSAK